MYKCIIIDDEAHAVKGLKKYFELLERFTVVETFTDSVKALNYLSSIDKIDLLLVDVDMPKVNGIELIQTCRVKVDKIIITTAYSSYAYEGFEVQADGFLLKPFPISKLIGILSKLFPPIGDKHESENIDYFFVKNRDEQMSYVKVKFDEFIYAESKLNYVHIYTTGGNLKIYSSLSELKTNLQSSRGILQLHRSFIVNIAHINTVIGNMVTLSDGTRIGVGEKYRYQLLNLIKRRMVAASIKRLS